MTIRHNQIVVFKSLINMQPLRLNFKGEIEKRYFSVLQLFNFSQVKGNVRKLPCPHIFDPTVCFKHFLHQSA